MWKSSEMHDQRARTRSRGVGSLTAMSHSNLISRAKSCDVTQAARVILRNPVFCYALFDSCSMEIDC